jgi:hypothetical protein
MENVDFQFTNIKNYGNISPLFSIKTNSWKQRALIDVIYVSILLLNMAGDQSESEKFECCCKINKFPVVFRGVDPYLPLFTSSHGQNVVDSRGAAVINAW